MIASGTVTVSISDIGGDICVLSRQKNLEVYQSGDAMACLADPQKNYSLNYMYFEFRNGSPSPPAPALADNIDYYSGLVDPEDYLRVPIIAAPAYDVETGEEAAFGGNRITLLCTTKSAPVNSGGQIVGEANGVVFTDGLSQIHSAGLVASNGNKSEDLLFARINLASGPVTKQAGTDVDLHWAVKFGPPIA